MLFQVFAHSIAFSGHQSGEMMVQVRVLPLTKPPPQTLPECVTPRAKPIATAASMAFPPLLRAATPIAVALVSPLTTIECFARTDWAALEATMEGVAMDLDAFRAKVARVERRPA